MAINLKPASQGPDQINGADVVNGTFGSYNIDGQGPTLNALDSIQNVGFLNLFDGFGSGNPPDIIPTGAFLQNIYQVTFATNGNLGGGAGNPLDTSIFTGIGTLATVSFGGGTDFVKAGPSTAMSVTQNSTTGGADVTGGSVVFVTSAGSGGVIVGNTGLGSVPLTGLTPSGLVNVTENGLGNVNIMGGTDVTVTVNSSLSGSQTGTQSVSFFDGFDENGNPTFVTENVPVFGGDIEIGNTDANTGNSASGAVANPTGAITVIDYGANNGGTITVFGGSSVTVNALGDAITVGDEENSLNDTTGDVNITNFAPDVFTDYSGFQNETRVYGGDNVNINTNTGGVLVDGASGAVTIVDTATAEDNTYSGGGSGGGSGDVDITVYGGTDVNVKASGVDVSVYGSSKTVIVNDFADSIYDGITNTDNEHVTVEGGTSVTVNSNSGSITVGNAAGGTHDPSGAIVLQNFSTGFFGAENVSGGPSDAPDSVDAFGGSSVDIFAVSGSIQVGGGTAASTTTGPVSVRDLGVNTGAQYENHIAVEGGTNVTVVTSGAGGTFTGHPTGATGGISIGTNATPVTGVVTVIDTYSGLHSEPITVLGGTSVKITDSVSSGAITVGGTPLLNPAGTGLTAASLALDPTGTVEIDEGSGFLSGKFAFGTGVINVTTNGSTLVDITGGGKNPTITDAQSTLANTIGAGNGLAVGTSTLQQVRLNGITGTATVTSDALAYLSITNSSSSTVNVLDDAANSSLTVKLLNSAGVTLSDHNQALFTGANANGSVKNLEIDSTGGANSILLQTGSVSALGLVVSAGSLTLMSGGALNSLKTIDVSGAGSVALGDLSGLGTLTNVIGTNNGGGISAEINPGNTSFVGGSGNDTVVLKQNAFGSGVKLDGGAGNNTIYAAYAAATVPPLDIALGTITLNQFNHFQNLGVVGSAMGAYDARGFTNLVVGGLNVPGQLGTAVPAGLLNGIAGPVQFTHVTQGTPLTLLYTGPGGYANTVSYQLDTPFTAGGSLSIVDGVDQVSGQTFSDVNLAGQGITSVSISSVGAAGESGNGLKLDGAALTSVTITGDQSLLLNNDPLQVVKTINASGTTAINKVIDVNNVGLAATGVTVNGGASELDVGQSAAGAARVGAVDVFNVGSGGGQITLGAGGAGFNSATGHGTGGGSETVYLTANAPIGTTIVASPVIDGTNGAYGIVNGWNTAGTAVSHATADSLLFTDQPIIIKSAIGVTVNTHTYNISDGVITSTGTVSFLNELQDAQAIVDAAPLHTIAMVTILASQAAPQTATYVIENEGGGTKDVVVQLNGVGGTPGSLTGFGAVTDNRPSDPANIGAGTSVSLNTHNIDAVFANLIDNVSTGSATANQTTNEIGNEIVRVNASGAGFTTTFTGLGNFGVVETNTIGGGNVTVTQLGIDPTLTLTALGTTLLNTFTYGDGSIANDNPSLLLYAANGDIGITTLTDASNTGNTLLLSGGHNVVVGQVNDNGLTTIDASTLTGNLTITANQPSLHILDQPLPGSASGSLGSDTITANGANDTIIVGSAADPAVNQNANTIIHASGAGDHITVYGGTGGSIHIGASGDNDVISVSDTGGSIYVTGNGSHFSSALALNNPLATQLGSGDTINVTNANLHAWLGANAVVNISGVNSGVDLHLLGDIAGSTAGAPNLTTINSVDGLLDPANIKLHFNDVTAGNVSHVLSHEGWAAGDGDDSQVNVASAGNNFQQALDLAASQALVLNHQFGGSANTAGAGLAASTGLVDWFQFGGNTYLVEAVNATASSAAHAGLAANDIVVEITGLVDASQVHLAHSSLAA